MWIVITATPIPPIIIWGEWWVPEVRKLHQATLLTLGLPANPDGVGGGWSLFPTATECIIILVYADKSSRHGSNTFPMCRYPISFPVNHGRPVALNKVVGQYCFEMADKLTHPQGRVAMLFAVGGIDRVQQVMAHESGFNSRPQAVIDEALGAVAVEGGIKAEVDDSGVFWLR